jgi:hypothetical protein
MTDVIEVSRVVEAAPREVADLFWDIEAWQAIWDRIDQVEVGYDDGVHQEFAMDVQRDGRTEQVRTIRFRDHGGDIAFFSPTPPPTMEHHAGEWLFVPEGERCRVVARRRYRLRRHEREGEAAFEERWREYGERFSARLDRILGCFSEHFTPGVVCTRSIRIQRDAAAVGDFLAEVPNLPAWTGFFRSVGPAADGRHPVETLLGPAETWIEPGRDGYDICSLIRGQVERATLTVRPEPDGGVTVEFAVRLPDGASAEHAAAQRNRMGHELQTLGELIQRSA